MSAHRIPPRSLLLLFALLLVPTHALADGMFVWRNRGIDIVEPEQKALILQDRGWEDLVLEVKYSGKARDFGWIVPVPSMPALRADRARLFEHLSQATQNEDPSHAPDPPTMGIDGVEMLDHGRVGIYDTATLSAQRGPALFDWLRTHGYQVEDRAKSLLNEYAAKGWFFVAARIALPDSAGLESKLHEGTIQPLRLRFACNEPVFPLRVSAASGLPSEILLYLVSRKPLAAVDQPVYWNSNYCKAVPKWIWSDVDPDSRYEALQAGAMLLTKLRATVPADKMKDVSFGRVQPRDALSGLDTTRASVLRRARAASTLGAMRDTGSVAALIQFVRTPNRDVTELRSGIWALGQIRTDSAIREVAHWIGDQRDVLSRDAIVTLQESGSRIGVTECLERVAREPEHDAGAFPPYEDRWNPALQYLIHVLRAEDRDLVNAKLPPSSGQIPGDIWRSPSLRRNDWIRLAVSDPKTMNWVCDSLISQGSATAHPIAGPNNGSSMNWFPSAYWTGAAIAVNSLEGNWRFMSDVMEKTRDLPRQREVILHRLAMDPRLPEAGRVISISYLDSPKPAEWNYLRQVWKSARSSEDPHFGVLIRSMPNDVGVSIDYPTRACLVAYAFGKLRAVEDLVKMWTEVRGAPLDDVLRGDVAFALALTDSTPAVDPLVEYVRTTWPRKFETPRLVRWGRDPKPPKADLMSDMGIDLEYRTRRIIGTIAQRGTTPQIAPLIRDPTLPPYFRLFWVPNSGLYRTERADFVPIALRAIGQIEASAAGDSLLLDACGTARKMIGSSNKIRAGDFEF